MDSEIEDEVSDDTWLNIVNQEQNEERFNRKHIDAKIRAAFAASGVIQAKIAHGVDLLQAWLAKPYYASKQARLDELKQLDLTVLVTDIFVGIAYSQREELFVGVAARMAARLDWNDQEAAITTTAELLAVLTRTNAFNIDQMADDNNKLYVTSKLRLPKELIRFIEESQFLPPMVCTPLTLKHNFSSGYLTHNDSLILQRNHHDGDICLDVLNIMNRVPMKLAMDFIDTVEEMPKPSKPPRKPRAKQAWRIFKDDSAKFYKLMNSLGNRFFFTHKVDKRGRVYSVGYHIHTQGAPYKKACCELLDEEIVTGAPT